MTRPTNTTHRTARERSGRRGAYAVEFAIVLPGLVALLLGILECSLMLEHQLVVRSAAQASVRAAAMAPDDEQAVSIARAEVARRLSVLSVADADVRVDIVEEGPTRTVRVEIDVPYVSATGAIPGMPTVLRTSASLTMEGSSG